MTYREAIAQSIKHNVLVHIPYTQEIQFGLMEYADNIEPTPADTIYYGRNNLWSVRTVHLDKVSY
jgi:hypothetical protein